MSEKNIALQTTPPNIQAPSPKSLVRVGNQLHPITHSFVVKPRHERENVMIFEYFCDHRLPNVPGAQGSTTVNGEIVYDFKHHQGHHLTVDVDTNDNAWRWDFLPMSDFIVTEYKMLTHRAAHGGWVQGSPLIRIQPPAWRPEPCLVHVQDTVFWADGRWLDASVPRHFPFPHTFTAAPGRSPRPWREIEGSHAWFSFDYFEEWCEETWEPIDRRPYYVMWIRGPESLNWSWAHRNAAIDDALFTGRPNWWDWPPRPSWQRISPEWYDEPWKRYPHLM